VHPVEYAMIYCSMNVCMYVCMYVCRIKQWNVSYNTNERKTKEKTKPVFWLETSSVHVLGLVCTSILPLPSFRRRTKKSGVIIAITTRLRVLESEWSLQILARPDRFSASDDVCSDVRTACGWNNIPTREHLPHLARC